MNVSEVSHNLQQAKTTTTLYYVVAHINSIKLETKERVLSNICIIIWEEFLCSVFLIIFHNASSSPTYMMTTERRWQLDVVECYKNKKISYTGLQTKRIL